MLTRISAKQYLMLGTAMTGVAALVTPTAALADCLINATNDTVTCTTADTNGFQSSINLLTINVVPGATVTGTSLAAAAPLLSAGTQSVVNNEGSIDVTGAPAGTIAISLGGGSRVTEASTATGSIIGDINFGVAATGQTNTLENFKGTSTGLGITGNITSAGGNFVVTDNGTITGNITSSGTAGTTTINVNAQTTANGGNAVIAGNVTSANTTTINLNGDLTDKNDAIISGNVTLGAGNDTVNLNGDGTASGTNAAGVITGSLNLGGGNNALNVTGYDSFVGGGVTAGSGNDTVNNSSGVISGGVNLGDGNNLVNNSAAASLINGGITLGAGNDTVINNGLTASFGGSSTNCAAASGEAGGSWRREKGREIGREGKRQGRQEGSQTSSKTQGTAQPGPRVHGCSGPAAVTGIGRTAGERCGGSAVTWSVQGR